MAAVGKFEKKSRCLSPFSSANNKKSVKIFDVRDDGVGMKSCVFVVCDGIVNLKPSNCFNAIRDNSLNTPLDVRRST
jgi:hypothetical protein